MQRNQTKNYLLIFVITLFTFLILNALADLIYYGEINLISSIKLHNEFPVMYIFNSFILFVLPLISLMAYKYYVENVQKQELHNQENANRLEENILFTQKLIDNQLHFDAQVADNDVLGESLKQLRDRLIANKEEENLRKQEDERRSWATEGLARFADILRKNNNNNLNELGYNVISNLVKYLEANQGGFYVYKKTENKSEPDYFELSACYAYDKKRIRTQIINVGDGLVGRCGIERDTIYMTDIPGNYINITSGLGYDSPTSLILVPLISNDNLQGVMELASFKELQDYQIEFIENVSDIVASTIAGVKINIQTAKLLEESRAQESKLTSQEEEMRQNMEEMKMLQKEAAEQSEEFISFSNSVNHTLIRADYNVEGVLLYANTKFLSKMGYSSNAEVEGQNILSFINQKDKEWFGKIWTNLSKGGRHYEGFMKQMTKAGTDLWTLSTYTCVRDENRNVVKILYLAIDTTEFKKQSIQYEGMISALNRSNLRAEFGIDGSILDCNTNYINSLEMNIEEVKKHTLFELVNKVDEAKIRENWEQVVKNIAFDETLRYDTKEGKSVWFAGAFTSVRDMYGEVSSIVFVGHDVTEQVLVEKQVEKQNKTLKEQEKLLQENQLVLEDKLKEATQEMRVQLNSIEKIKILNEKTLEGALDGIFTIDDNGEIIFFNMAAQLMWGYSSTEVIGQHVKILFSATSIKTNDFISSLVDNNREKIIGERQEIIITDKNKEDKSVLILLSDASFENEHNYTAFIQNIELELF